jgi:hypothetical protein
MNGRGVSKQHSLLAQKKLRNVIQAAQFAYCDTLALIHSKRHMHTCVLMCPYRSSYSFIYTHDWYYTHTHTALYIYRFMYRYSVLLYFCVHNLYRWAVLLCTQHILTLHTYTDRDIALYILFGLAKARLKLSQRRSLCFHETRQGGGAIFFK